MEIQIIKENIICCHFRNQLIYQYCKDEVYCVTNVGDYAQATNQVILQITKKVFMFSHFCLLRLKIHFLRNIIIFHKI